MHLKHILISLLTFGLPMLLAAQPVIYNDNTTLVTGTWNAPNGGGESTALTEVTGETPYEGMRHYRFVYSFSNWWAGLGLNMDNWGSGPARNFSGFTHLRIAYRGLSAGQNLVIRLRNGNSFGNALTVGPQTDNYSVVELPLFALTVGSDVSADAVREINISIESPAMSGSGTVFFDAIELVNGSGGSSGLPASAATLARAAALGAGVNTSNWLEAYWLLPFNAYPEVNRYTRTRVQALRNAGITTFRLPVIFERLGDPNPPYNLNFNHIAFSLVDSMIAWAVELDFRLIIDNHHGLPLTNANYQSQITRLQAVWTQLANRYGNLDPERYFFELYNEPENTISNANWRTVAAAVLQTLRATETVTHSVFVGGANWNSGAALLSFTPLDDADVIYSFHYYDPYFFTHQGMSWTNPPYLAPRSFPQAGEMDELMQLMSAINDWSNLYQVPVSMGEFGCATSADAMSRCNWVNAVMNAVNTYGFSYFYWDAISPTDAFGFFNNGVVSEGTGIPCFLNALGLYMTPLAVELIQFELNCLPGRANLAWTAHSDERNDRFELQRSMDGIKWSVIHTINAAIGRRDYTFADEQLAAGSLYRLRCISADGSERFSPLRIAVCKDATEVSVFPNPASDLLSVQLSGTDTGIARIRLFDTQGRLLLYRDFGADSKNTQADISLLNFPPGIYLLSAQLTNGVMRHTRVVVER